MNTFSFVILFYHSSAEPAGVAGLAKVSKTAYADHSAFDSKDVHYDPKSKKEKPTWYMVDVAFVKKFKRLISLSEIKAQPGLKNMLLFRQGRLSVQPLAEKEFEIICQLV